MTSFDGSTFTGGAVAEDTEETTTKPAEEARLEDRVHDPGSNKGPARILQYPAGAEGMGSTQNYSTPGNPREVYKLIRRNLKDPDDITSDDARAIIFHHEGSAFFYLKETADKIGKVLGNQRLPNPEIRKANAKWLYRKGVERINHAIDCHKGIVDYENPLTSQRTPADYGAVKKLRIEKKLFETLYGDIDKLYREGPLDLPSHMTMPKAYFN